MEVVPAEIAKKPRTPTSGPVITKLIFAKPINSKAVTGQTTQVSPPVVAGRVLSQSTPGTPSKTITISESGVIGSTLNSTTQTPNKIAISPLKSPNKAGNYNKLSDVLHLPKDCLRSSQLEGKRRGEAHVGGFYGPYLEECVLHAFTSLAKTHSHSLT
uniref:Lin-54 DREAM MuvB core complex component n=1 Tax=Equus caballus TaxID=9796 RepID=A0A9L0R999_HORSE